MNSISLAAPAQLLWGTDRKTRIRLHQWSITCVIYGASAAAMAFGVQQGVLDAGALLAWEGFVLAGLSAFYGLLRSGWTTRFADGALTEWQIGFGVMTVLWGYRMCGDVRSATLFPLMVILMFGAFSLTWRRMLWLTLAALAALAAVMVAMHRESPGRFDARLDVANFLIVAIMLPATSVLAVLLAALRRHLQAQRSELKTALARIQDLATRDGLTGLTNRRHAQQLLELERQRAERSGRAFSLALIDLDHFKRVNDAHGHAGGDQALCAFAEAALATMRAPDTVARWGGEEFLLLMPQTEPEQAGCAVERLRRRVQALELPAAAGTLKFTLSAGAATHRPSEPVTETLARADRALYEAKAAGRNRVVMG
jgi:diguanylate cyclase (GGDEF)-like protein